MLKQGNTNIPFNRSEQVQQKKKTHFALFAEQTVWRRHPFPVKCMFTLLQYKEYN